MSKFIVLDIVFHASSLNYGQGTGNFQELKKITKWDGRQYTLVSRYAIRYSILHWANKIFGDKWKLAGPNELDDKKGVVQPTESIIKEILSFPEFDLFGYMITKTKSKKKKTKSEETEQSVEEDSEVKDDKNIAAYTRVAPVKISHAISLTPFNYEALFNANLDLAKRSGKPTSINPFNIEEHKDFYTFNITIDLDRMGKKDDINQDINELTSDQIKDRIAQFIEVLFNLKREIKGRLEDLSPELMIIGLYNDGRYETYLDKIELAKSNSYRIITKEKEDIDKEGRKIKDIENQIIEKQTPMFILDTRKEYNESTKSDITKKIDDFLNNKSVENELMVYKKDMINICKANDIKESKVTN